MARVNNLDLEALAKTREAVEKGEAPAEKVFAAEGEWLFSDEGLFKGKIEYPGGVVEIISDQPPQSGGYGKYPNPVQYCVFSMIACYATTFMTLAATKGVSIKKFKIKGGSVANMKAIMEIEEGPIVKEVFVDVEVESDADEEVIKGLLEEANKKCPAAYTVQNAVPFKANLTYKKA